MEGAGNSDLKVKISKNTMARIKICVRKNHRINEIFLSLIFNILGFTLSFIFKTDNKEMGWSYLVQSHLSKKVCRVVLEPIDDVAM